MPAPLRRTWPIIAVVVLVLGVVGAGIYIAKEWPFARASITRRLEEESGGKVTIGSFRETWFPPGCVAGNVSISRNSFTEVAIQKLSFEATWHGLLARHIHRVTIAGARLLIPPPEDSSAGLQPSGSKTQVSGIGEVLIDGAVVEFLPHKGETAHNIFKLHRVTIDHFAKDRTAAFHASLTTENPPGELAGDGSIGPWKTGQTGYTPISGSYHLSNADLKVFKGLRGKVSSQGKFQGVVSRMEAEGAVDVPDFHVDGSAHSEHLTAKFRAAVDSHNADTTLESAEAKVGKTIILANGKITSDHPNAPKTARLEMAINTGRLEDLLNYFSEQKRASMTGAVRLRASVELPPGTGFLKRVKLTGDFGVSGAEFTNPQKQLSVNRLSEPEDAATVLSNLKGHVAINNGTATLRKVSFEFPGNYAILSGTYQLIPKTVDLHGTLQTDGKLSSAATGFKSLMLKVVTPFLKKKGGTTVVPFAIKGSASNPSITLDLHNKTRL